MERPSKVQLTKVRAYMGRPFGVNTYLDKSNKLPSESEGEMRRLLGLYFEWTQNIEDPKDRRTKRVMAAFVVRDLRTQGKLLIPTAGDETDGVMYNRLRERKGQVDTTEVRKFVCRKMAELAVNDCPEDNEIT